MTIRTQPHWIRPNEASRIPGRWVYLDTESYSTVVQGRTEQNWRLGVTAFEHRDTRERKWTEPDVHVWHDPFLMWDYVSGCARPKTRTVVVAHNIGYDLRISRALEFLPEMGWDVDVMSIGGRNLTMTLRRDRATLVLTDFMSWLPMSLDKIGTMVGIDKSKLPDNDGDLLDWIDRCTKDVEILRAANRELLEWLEKSDLGNWQKTGASMAWSGWRHRHYTHPVLVHADSDARDAEVLAAATGRCEARKHGVLPKGTWYEWDLPAAYPRVCVDTELPIVLMGHDWNPTNDRYSTPREGRRTLFTATVTTETPVLPVSTPEGWLWPVGTFSGSWWDHEVSLAREYGARVELTHAIQYKSAPALSQWATWILDVIQNDDGPYTDVQRAAAKHWSRALIGRFGAKFPRWVSYGESPEYGLELAPCLDLDTQKLGHILTVGTTSYLGMDEEYVADANPAIMGAVVSECRIRLWQLLQVAGEDNVAYLDTDSLIVNKEGHARLTELTNNGGGWGMRVKGRYKSLEILGPRQMILDGHGRISGLPRRAVKTGETQWRGERWDGMQSTLSSGHTGTVVIREAVWNVNGVDRRRLHVPNGETLPLRVRLTP